ncbi:MAG TPA: hypothetical protein VMY35_12125 [Phycisphaerae bacterium]|nr:hypothetical protein [Phycisphaerae bacterium]
MGTQAKQKAGLGLSRHDAAIIYDGAVVALAVGDEKTADEMVRRFNAHDDLLAACRMALEILDNCAPRGKNEGAVGKELRAAIAKAEA